MLPFLTYPRSGAAAAGGLLPSLAVPPLTSCIQNVTWHMMTSKTNDVTSRDRCSLFIGCRGSWDYRTSTEGPPGKREGRHWNGGK